ncbi:hypothetical protein LEMLEM_LOCUS10619, partial [Lemmus lemmus]
QYCACPSLHLLRLTVSSTSQREQARHQRTGAQRLWGSPRLCGGAPTSRIWGEASRLQTDPRPEDYSEVLAREQPSSFGRTTYFLSDAPRFLNKATCALPGSREDSGGEDAPGPRNDFRSSATRRLGRRRLPGMRTVAHGRTAFSRKRGRGG